MGTPILGAYCTGAKLSTNLTISRHCISHQGPCQRSKTLTTSPSSKRRVRSLSIQAAWSAVPRNSQKSYAWFQSALLAFQGVRTGGAASSSSRSLSYQSRRKLSPPCRPYSCTSHCFHVLDRCLAPTSRTAWSMRPCGRDQIAAASLVFSARHTSLVPVVPSCQA